MKNLSTAREGEYSSFLPLITSYLSLIRNILMNLLCHNMIKNIYIYIYIYIYMCIYIEEKIYMYIKEL